MTRLLILSASAGNGHVRAAQALLAAAADWPDAPQANHLDALQYVSAGFRKVYSDGYLALVNRYPDFWAYVHQKSDKTPHTAPSQRLRRAVERLSSSALLREVRAQRPDAIVCTHFLPAELLLRERQRGRLNAPLWLQVTDYDLHNMWIVPGMDGYFAATEEVAHRMRARGLPAERVHVTGIPVMPAFAQGYAGDALARIATELGLDPARPIVLMISGGAGMGELPALVERALSLSGDFQIIAVAGRNAATKEALDALALREPSRLLAVGFTNEMHRLMNVARLVVTKPGGLTVSECMALGKPMLLIAPIPGQEEHNAGFLLEEGAAALAYDDIGLEYKLMKLMADLGGLATMAARSRALGKPDAARAVLKRVLAKHTET